MNGIFHDVIPDSFCPQILKGTALFHFSTNNSTIFIATDRCIEKERIEIRISGDKEHQLVENMVIKPMV